MEEKGSGRWGAWDSVRESHGLDLIIIINQVEDETLCLETWILNNFLMRVKMFFFKSPSSNASCNCAFI